MVAARFTSDESRERREEFSSADFFVCGPSIEPTQPCLLLPGGVAIEVQTDRVSTSDKESFS